MRILELFALLGAVQGAFLLLLIALRYRHQKSLAIGALLFVFSLRLGTIPAWNYDTMVRYPALFPLTTPLPYLFGPLLWWHIRELQVDMSTSLRKLRIHALPYVVNLLVLTVFVLFIPSERFALFMERVFAGSPPIPFIVNNAAKVFINVAYVVAAGRIAFGRRTAHLVPAKRIWIRTLFSVSAVVLLFFTYVALAPAATVRIDSGVVLPFLLLAIAMSALIYTVTFLVVFFPEFFSRSELDAVAVDTGHHAAPVCSDEECRVLHRRLGKYLDEGAFRNPDLALTDAAHYLNVPPNRLSYAINRAGNVSFRKLINQYRLDFVVDGIRNGYLATHSILDLAMEAGFPAKSTFNRVFKETYGISPSEYARALSQN